MCSSIIVLLPIFKAMKVYNEGLGAGVVLLEAVGQIITIPIYVCLFLFWKYNKGTKLVPLMEVDLLSDNILESERADIENNWPFGSSEEREEAKEPKPDGKRIARIDWDNLR